MEKEFDEELRELIIRHHKLIDIKRFLPDTDNKDYLSRLSTTTPSLYRAYKELSPEGRNPVLLKDKAYSLNPYYAFFMGISIGASICKVTMVDMTFDPISGEIADRFLTNTCKVLKEVIPADKQTLLKKCEKDLSKKSHPRYYIFFDTPSSLLELKQVLDCIIKEALNKDYGYNILGITISTTGMVNSIKHEVESASNLKYLENQEIRTLLYPECYSRLEAKNITVSLIQNANASVISEVVNLYKANSPQKECKNIASLYLGVGFGLGLCLNGEIYYGTDGYSGEIGHIAALDLEKEELSEKERKVSEKDCDSECTCGKIRCYDYKIRKYVFLKKASEFRKLSTDEVVEPFGRDENNTVPSRFRLLGKYIGSMIASLINTLNLDLIVLSGRLYKFDKELLNYIEEALDDYSITTSRKSCKIIFSENGTVSPALGAAIYAYYAHYGLVPSWNLEGKQYDQSEYAKQ